MLAKSYAARIRRSRIALYTFLPFAALAAVDSGPMAYVQPVLRILYIVAGFSLIIFLHELGHFVVARLCSVKCLAFSIGIGPRMFGWRKHGRLSFGKDPYDTTDGKSPAPPAENPNLTDGDGHAVKHRANPVESDLQTTAREPHHPTAVGDCDYRISWLPLGGYVRMLGQDDMDPTKVSNDPHAFNRRPIWQRMCIVSAGVIMNLIFAAVCFSIIFSPAIGVDFPPARLGVVQFDSPGWKAGLRPGDEILEINGEKPRGFLEFTDIQMYAALSSGSDSLHFKVKKADGTIIPDVPIVPTRSASTGFLAIGVESMPGTKLVGSGDDYKKDFDDMAKRGDIIPAWMTANKEALLKIRTDDRITAIDGNDIHGQYMELNSHLQSQSGKPVKLTLVNKDTKLAPQEIEFTPHIEPLPGVDEFPSVMGLAPRLIIGLTQDNMPAAEAGLKPGDRIIAVGDRHYPTAKAMIEIINNTGGKPITVKIERGGNMIEKVITPKLKDDKYKIGVGPLQDIQTATFIPPPQADSPVAALNLPPDATIVKIDDQAVSSWEQIYGVLKTKSPGDIKVTFSSSPDPVTLNYTKDEQDAVSVQLHYQLGVHLEIETKTQKADNIPGAVMMGLDHTKKFILNVYMTLLGLARRTVDPSNLHGIVGITKIGYDVQERGPVWLWYVLAMVSVNLAVANFLPLPIVDGGLFLLLILEKIRGKPLSLKVQSAIQMVGIVLLASLFLFVTMNDIKLF